LTGIVPTDAPSAGRASWLRLSRSPAIDIVADLSKPPPDLPSVALAPAATRLDTVLAFAGAFLGCLLTLAAIALGAVPAIASAAATLLLCGVLLLMPATTPGRTSLLTGSFCPALQGGTFAGMTSVSLLIQPGAEEAAALPYELFIVLSVICGLCFFLAARLDDRTTAPAGAGLGGRSGAIAAVASLVFVALEGMLGADSSRIQGAVTGPLGTGSQAAALGFLVCLAGTAGTLFSLRQQHVALVRSADRIFVVAGTALCGLGALLLSDASNPHLLNCYYAGCFLGMSTRERLRGWIRPVFGALVLSAMVSAAGAILPGIGGALGLAAFITAALLAAMGGMPGHADGPAAAGMEAALDRARPEPAGPPARRAAPAVAAALTAALVLAWPSDSGTNRSDDAGEEPAASVEVAMPPPAALDEATPPIAVVDAAAREPEPAAAPEPPADAQRGDLTAFSGLPAGLSIVSGRPLGAREWLLFTSKLAGFAVRPAPKNNPGAVELSVATQRAERPAGRPAPALDRAPAGTATRAAGRSLSARVLVDQTQPDNETVARESAKNRQAAPPSRRTPRPPGDADPLQTPAAPDL
jgi:hypothetical protein